MCSGRAEVGAKGRLDRRVAEAKEEVHGAARTGGLADCRRDRLGGDGRTRSERNATQDGSASKPWDLEAPSSDSLLRPPLAHHLPSSPGAAPSAGSLSPPKC